MARTSRWVGRWSSQVGSLDGLAYPQIARHDDVFPTEQEQGALHSPRAYLRNRDELCHEWLWPAFILWPG